MERWRRVFDSPATPNTRRPCESLLTYCHQDYLHIFAKGQPDLNWESAAVRAAIHEDAVRFWMAKGVDGFRVDTCNIYSKDPALRDGPVTPDREPYGDANPGIVNGPRIHEYWREMRTAVLDDFGDPLMVGELAASSVEETLRFVGRKQRELSMVFDFTYTALGEFFPSFLFLFLFFRVCFWSFVCVSCSRAG